MIKELTNYLDTLQESFPNIARWKLEEICTVAFQELMEVTRRGIDVDIRKNLNEPVFILDSRAIKIDKMIYKSRKGSHKDSYIKKQWHPKYKGYYYFTLNNKEWEKYKQKIFNNWYITFEKLILYDTIDPLLYKGGSRRIFRLPIPVHFGRKLERYNFTLKDIQFYAFIDNNRIKMIEDDETVRDKFVYWGA